MFARLVKADDDKLKYTIDTCTSVTVLPEEFLA